MFKRATKGTKQAKRSLQRDYIDSEQQLARDFSFELDEALSFDEEEPSPSLFFAFDNNPDFDHKKVERVNSEMTSTKYSPN